MADNSSDDISWLLDFEDPKLMCYSTTQIKNEVLDDIMREYKTQEVRIRLVRIIPNSPDFQPDYFWAFLIKNPDDGDFYYSNRFIPVFKMDDLEGFWESQDKEIMPVPINAIFWRNKLPYMNTVSDESLAVIRIRYLLQASLIKELCSPPDEGSSVKCYPVKGYNLYDGKYIGVFWCVELNGNEQEFIPVDSRFTERINCAAFSSYDVHRDERIILGDPDSGYHCFYADTDENGLCSLEKLDIPVTEQMLEEEKALLPGEKLKMPPELPTERVKVQILPDKTGKTQGQPTEIIEFSLN